MNIRGCWMVCVIALAGCGDDDGAPDSGVHDAAPDAPIESGVHDAMPDAPIEAGIGACDGPFQHPLHVAPFEGTCLGPARAVPGSCVTGIEGMTGNGELWCFTSPEGVLHAGLIQFGEYAVDPGEFGGNHWDAGDVDAGDPNEACERALSQIDWSPDADAGFEEGAYYYPALGHLPLCRAE